MDSDEDGIPDTGSACKRRKIQIEDGENEDCNIAVLEPTATTEEIHVEELMEAASASNAAAAGVDLSNDQADDKTSEEGSEEPTVSTTDQPEGSETPKEVPQKQEAPAPQPRRPDSPFLGFRDSRNSLPRASVSGAVNNTPVVEISPLLFNLRSIPADRFYRRLDGTILETLSDSDSSTEPNDVYGYEDTDDDEDNHAGPGFDSSIWSSDTSSISSFPLQSDTTDSIEDDDDDPIIANNNNVVNALMQKPKPAYTFNFALDLMEREHNMTNRIGWRRGHTSSSTLSQSFYSSRQVVEQMTLHSRLSKHQGCVNCLNFNLAGDLICSGSDDRYIVIWDWARKRPIYRFKSGHGMNVFQTKFIDSAGCLDIVSAGRDGHVMRAVVPPSGANSIKPTRLYMHSDSVHKIVVVPQSRYEVLSAGEDAAIMRFDLRSGVQATTILRCVSTRFEDDPRPIRLFGISHHPFAPEFCVCGADDKVRVYDSRRLTHPVHLMTPGPKEGGLSQVTCAVYNYSGSEILASYKDGGIYLYDSHNCKGGKQHCYKGHINCRTIKGVNFFGPQSEYIITGSDCGHIFIYDKNTEAIVNYIKGDHIGVVNCLEPHPWMPVLATSGLEHDVKIWAPNGTKEMPYNAAALKKTVTRNLRQQMFNAVDHNMDQFNSFIRQFLEINAERSRLDFFNYAGASDNEDPPQIMHEDSSDSNSDSPSSPSSPEDANSTDSAPDNDIGEDANRSSP